MTAHEFWRNTPFSYIITYSFNRGEKLAALTQAAKAQLATLRQELLTVPSAQLPAVRENLRSLERGRDLESLPLTEANGAYHITATPVARIAAESSVANQMAAILAAPVQQQFQWMCGPVYRDSLAFYDSQDDLCAVLNICFGCDKMLTDKHQEIAADAATYHQLKQLLTQLGHDVTEQ